MEKAMLDLDEKILDLKRNGKSLREIGSVLQISHEAARKRLKALAGEHCLSTRKENKGLTASTSNNELESTCPNPHLSTLLGDSEMCVNQVSTSKAPSHTLDHSVNPSGIASGKLPGSGKRVFQGVLLQVDGLSEQIKQFLQSKGIKIHSIQVGQEAYQVKHKGQTIRFYVQRTNVGSEEGEG